ncbi:MAG TPA: FAD-dependent oxidoreductase [Woeseiaceae bacterium]|nr:FAD-dependent oxidoreductase [Woeseiaceae bacterium]
MRIAVIGTGIAGNTVAYRLRGQHDLTVYEAAGHIGGHTNTVDVEEDGRSIPIDTGFIVFNDRTYPNFLALLAELGQPTRRSVMSFSVQTEDGRLEYNGASLNALFSQRRNILRPPFYRMVRDILRFNREAVTSLSAESQAQTVGGYLLKHGYGREFIDCYLVPMAAAIWSAEPVAIERMPLRFLVTFFENHGLLQLRDRPAWHVIEGGSREYVGRMVAGHRHRIRLHSPVLAVHRHPQHVEVFTAAGGRESFDAVFIACHSDQARALLADPSLAEAEILGAIRYQHNEAVLHTDASIMPRRRRAWAAWNYHLPRDPARHVSVTYNMNVLQGLDTRLQYFVTLNNDGYIDPAKVIRRIAYEHPVYSRGALAAQARQAELNDDRTFYCGAYWRNGFHEDGVVSALNALGHFAQRFRHAELHLRRAG